MTDNTPPSSGEPAGSQAEGPRRRNRRRRGSRPAGTPAQEQGASGGREKKDAGEPPQGKKQNQQGTNRRRNRGKGKSGQGKPKQNSQNNQPKQQNRKSRGRGAQARTNRPAARHARYADHGIETRDETSAGGLVVSGMAEAVGKDGSVDLSKIYVALIGRLDRRGRLLWSMPKGHVEPGEKEWATAEREVWEETGITGEAFFTLGVIDYWFVSEGVRIHKTVHHNLLRYVDGVLNDEDPEVTEVAWVPMSELIEHLAYADERKLARIAFDEMPDLARKEAAAGRATPR
ncbi:Putative mutator protein MutT4 [Corynebacterium capitovis DSM 44611]|uniref:NUDIX hydrolase n=1 Tax=Corynebacterium capitovis TaxID=131081 RepID=UPI000377632F|nr:Putative mutator protein MutT4 [Corynebacterium capitovis DSM 44611]